jgi:NADPH:quinone reductase-like Zn-dependent oxidoreductase
MHTQAWVLHPSKPDTTGHVPSHLQLESIDLPELSESDVLVEPILASWEGNMSHALRRDPVDLCHHRREPWVVIGNAGVVRVLRPGIQARQFKEGDLCLVFCNGCWDEHGYPIKIYGFDAHKTIGLLSKRTKLDHRQLIRLPVATRHSIEQWAAFSLRYVTAWANWNLAYGCFRLHAARPAVPHVWGWGGGVALAQLQLAQAAGCVTTMLTSQNERVELLRKLGIQPLDRRTFEGLQFDPCRFQKNAEFRRTYAAAEEKFLQAVRELTTGRGVSIFIDYIGLPVYRATLRALGRPGVLTTAGWKEGMELTTLRAMECMSWHTHVHTHYATFEQGLEAVAYAEGTGWLPPISEKPWPWEEADDLGQANLAGKVKTPFPLIQVNPL